MKIDNLNSYQVEYLTIIYYYVTIKENKINIPIDFTAKLFEIKIEDLNYDNHHILKDLLSTLDNIISNSWSITYNEDLTDDSYLLSKYQKLKRLTKLQNML
jgi:hypothetical protein